MCDGRESAVQSPTLSVHIATLSREAVERCGAHPDSARQAARATLRRLRGGLGARHLSYAERHRVRAYYLAVLRNAAFERSKPADRAYRERLRVASLVEDLRAADASEARILQEVEAFFGRGALEYVRGAVAVS